MWVRGTWPRFRIDQMLKFAWKALVPASLANLVWVAVALKLPVGTAGQYLFILAGNLVILFATLTLLGRSARRYAEQQQHRLPSAAIQS
jgi:NADH-quinone oxidoreductase subunit H